MQNRRKVGLIVNKCLKSFNKLIKKETTNTSKYETIIIFNFNTKLQSYK